MPLHIPNTLDNLKVPESKKKKDWHLLEFAVPFSHITEKTDKSEGFFIEGIAINETLTRNGIKYEADELEKAASSLIGKPMLKDHEAMVDNIVGKVKDANFDQAIKALTFKSQVMDKGVIEKISDGRLNWVSIGAMVKDLVKRENEDFVVAKGIEIVELSFTPIPGDPGASFGKALSEAYNLKESQHNALKRVAQPAGREILEEEKMTDEDKDKPKDNGEDKKDAQLAELKAKLAERDATLEKIEADRLAVRTKEYIALCEKVKVTPKEDLDNNALDLLMPALEEIATMKVDAKDSALKSKVPNAEPNTDESGKDSISFIPFSEENAIFRAKEICEIRGTEGAYWKMPGPNGELTK